ncbi:MarR family winged helix-turn-helix transcriptional regulator [Arthrobacter alkaliphilus]|uniref:MarR family winged helix-turn-helix transcriptional regulator n=1 Tax=Arthrobacter alkaliphilus TaxID=369936 RepID=UPI001F33965C|nr:MarR family transcriptional regulator [Arthrobacter alkaliphilus]
MSSSGSFRPPSGAVAATGQGHNAASGDPMPRVPGADYPGRELMLVLQGFTRESERYAGAVGRLHGLHRTDLEALTALIDAQREGRRITPGVLGAELAISSAATTAVLERLGKMGHLVRERSDADRRQVNVSVTDTARASGVQMFSPMVDELLKVLARHPAEEVELLSAFVAELSEAIVRAREQACASGSE